MRDDITVVIPVHPPRLYDGKLDRALRSVAAQTLLPTDVHISIDTLKQGAAATRLRGLETVQTEWVAFLDSDDEYMTRHLEELTRHAYQTGAEYVYSWFETVPAGGSPFPAWFETEPWDDANPRHTTMNIMVKTKIAQDIGFVVPAPDADFSNEDWHFTLACVDRGVKISHLPEKTWLWHMTGGNTSGLPSRW